MQLFLWMNLAFAMLASVGPLEVAQTAHTIRRIPRPAINVPSTIRSSGVRPQMAVKTGLSAGLTNAVTRGTQVLGPSIDLMPEGPVKKLHWLPLLLGL